MSATGTPTPNLGLRIPLGTDPAAVEDINYNAGVLDTKIGAIGNDTVKGLLDHAGDEINALGDGLAIIANGNTHAAIAAGEFVFVRNHGSLATGLYKATTAIAANGALSSSNLTADSKGGLNSLSDQISNLVQRATNNYSIIYSGFYAAYSMDAIFPGKTIATAWLEYIVDNDTNEIIDDFRNYFTNGNVYIGKASQTYEGNYTFHFAAICI